MEYTILQSVYKNDNPVFLDECFDSINSSTLKPMEIILVKDGPISKELEMVIEKWTKKLNIRLYGYLENKGLAHALNYGIQFISTEYVARMDSDDICYPERFQVQLENMLSNKDWEICGTGITEFYIDKNGEKKIKTRLYPEVSTKKSLYKGTPIGHPTVMVKKDLLIKYRYSEDTSMNEDLDLWFRLIRDGIEIHNINKPLLYFRITDGTFKRRSVQKALNEFRIYTTNLIQLFGLNWRLCFPLARLLTRFFPYCVNKKLYFSNLRNKLLNK